MNEFEHTLNSIHDRHSMDVSDLAERAGYDSLFFRNIVTGKSRQIPVNFFVRIVYNLTLSTEEKDAPIRSWTLGAKR